MHPMLRDVLKTLLEIAVPLASLVVGMRAASVHKVWLLKRPGLLVRSLLSILVIVPVGVVAFLQLVHAAPVVTAGLSIAVVAIGIGPPALFGRTKQHDKAANEADAIAYDFALNVILMVLAIVYIPAIVALHGMIFHHHPTIEPTAIAKVVLGRALIPLAIGIVLARLAPRVVAPLSKYLGLFVMAVLLVVVAFAILALWRDLVQLGGRAWLLCSAIVLGEIVVGHLMGGPALETRRVLASFCSVRFPALALLLAHVAPRGKELVPVILAYVLVSLVFTGVYGAVSARREHHGPANQPRGSAPRAKLGTGRRFGTSPT